MPAALKVSMCEHEFFRRPMACWLVNSFDPLKSSANCLIMSLSFMLIRPLSKAAEYLLQNSLAVPLWRRRMRISDAVHSLYSLGDSSKMCAISCGFTIPDCFKSLRNFGCVNCRSDDSSSSNLAYKRCEIFVWMNLKENIIILKHTSSCLFLWFPFILDWALKEAASKLLLDALLSLFSHILRRAQIDAHVFCLLLFRFFFHPQQLQILLLLIINNTSMPAMIFKITSVKVKVKIKSKKRHGIQWNPNEIAKQEVFCCVELNKHVLLAKMVIVLRAGIW